MKNRSALFSIITAAALMLTACADKSSTPDTSEVTGTDEALYGGIIIPDVSIPLSEGKITYPGDEFLSCSMALTEITEDETISIMFALDSSGQYYIPDKEDIAEMYTVLNIQYLMSDEGYEGTLDNLEQTEDQQTISREEYESEIRSMYADDFSMYEEYINGERKLPAFFIVGINNYSEGGSVLDNSKVYRAICDKAFEMISANPDIETRICECLEKGIYYDIVFYADYTGGNTAEGHFMFSDDMFASDENAEFQFTENIDF